MKRDVDQNSLYPTVETAITNKKRVESVESVIAGEIQIELDDICFERYAQRPVGSTGPGVHRPGRYSLRFVRNIGMGYNGGKDLGPADMVINC